MKRRAFLAGAVLAGLAPGRLCAQEAVEAMPFSSLAAGAPMPGWLQPYVFANQPRHTEFTLVEDEGRTVLRARAEASTSGLVRELSVDPLVHPMLAWSWKVTRLPLKADLATKAGDDFAARLYVLFDLPVSQLSTGDRMRLALARAMFGERVPSAALCYVWDLRAQEGTMAPSAYTDRVRLVVVDSGSARLGRWVSRRRDVAADFRAAFGIEPPRVAGVVVSSDTDNTGERAEAFFGDVSFRGR